MTSQKHFSAFIMGISQGGLPIIGYRFLPSTNFNSNHSENNSSSSDSKSNHSKYKKVLILGGVHGDEIEGVIAAQALVENFVQNFPFSLDITVVPQFNIDGVLRRTRGNINGIDLNRNMNTKDWSPEIKTPRYNPGPKANSESESRILEEYILEHSPCWILSLHSWQPVLNVNGNCLKQAQAIANHTGYRIDDSIGYPTPGCLGTFAGIERQSPTLTYEIERGLPADEIYKHIPGILAALKATEQI